MSTDAWNKITQTHDLFKKIIAPLKQHLGINFGYMIVFNDGSYYQIIEDLECLKKWVANVKTSHIFCARNVTTYFDEPYNFTIWPEEPTCAAMEIYKEYGMWNGITVSKSNKNYTELYWFTKQNAENGWHKWFIRNKQIWLEFIKRFSNYKDELHIVQNIALQDLFKFSNGFKTQTQNSEYVDRELVIMNRTRAALQSGITLVDHFQEKIKLSPREIEVLAIIGQGYTYKIAAQKLMISPKTVIYHVEHIKGKIGLSSKTDLINFYQNYKNHR